MKRTYPIVCPSCNGTGRVPEIGTSINSTRMCPACGGSKVVMVEEQDELNAWDILTRQ